MARSANGYNEIDQIGTRCNSFIFICSPLESHTSNTLYANVYCVTIAPMHIFSSIALNLSVNFFSCFYFDVIVLCDNVTSNTRERNDRTLCEECKIREFLMVSSDGCEYSLFSLLALVDVCHICVYLDLDLQFMLTVCVISFVCSSLAIQLM